MLPAYPVRVACESLAEVDLSGDALLSAFADALGVFYNYTKVGHSNIQAQQLNRTPRAAVTKCRLCGRLLREAVQGTHQWSVDGSLEQE